MIVPQVFEIGDLGIVAFLVLLEGLLSADNALIMAIMVRHLPANLQRKALFYGLGGAFVFRFIAILFASKIIAFWWLQAFGAFYLIYLPVKHFRACPQRGDVNQAVGQKHGFWKTVLLIELADIGFAIDSVIAGVALVKVESKLWIVYLGAIIGIVLLRLAAGVFIKLLQKMPSLDHVAYLLVGWVGIKLGFMAGSNYVKNYNRVHEVPLWFDIPEMNKIVFWSVLTAILVLGTLYAHAQSKKIPLKQSSKASGLDG